MQLIYSVLNSDQDFKCLGKAKQILVTLFWPIFP